MGENKIAVRRTSIRSLAIVIVLGAAGVLAYQNCAPIQQSKVLSSEQSKFDSIAPWAFKARMDTYAYMSCGNKSGLNPATHFSVRLGALFPGSGIKYDPDFLLALDEQRIKRSKLPTLFQGSRIYKGTQLQVSARTGFSLPGDPIGPTGGDPLTFVTRPKWGALTSTDLVNQLGLLSSGQYLNTWQNYKLMGQVKLTSADENAARNVLIGGQNSGVMVLGFQGTFYSSERLRGYGIISPGDRIGTQENSVYGIGYRASFRPPVGSDNYIFSPPGNRVLQSVNGTHVVIGDSVDSFDPDDKFICTKEAQYRIVTTNDQALAAGCLLNQSSPRTPPTNATANDMKIYNAANDILNGYGSFLYVQGDAYGDLWVVDHARKCIIKKTADTTDNCYLPTLTVDYNSVAGSNCNEANEQCPHYFSMCFAPSAGVAGDF